MSTILIVEDEPCILELLAVLLEDHGFQVRAAGNGQQALEQIGRHAPDLVLSDVMMPVMDGRELVRRLHVAGCRIPVVLMSAAPEEAVADLSNGVRFLRKPFDIWHLVSVIRATLNEQRSASSDAPP